MTLVIPAAAAASFASLGIGMFCARRVARMRRRQRRRSETILLKPRRPRD